LTRSHKRRVPARGEIFGGGGGGVYDGRKESKDRIHRYSVVQAKENQGDSLRKERTKRRK